MLWPTSLRARFIGLVALALAALVWATLPAASEASVVAALSTEELVDQSDIVCLAAVERTDVQMDDLGRIVTDAELRVHKTWKGTTRPGDTVTLRRLGGTLGDLSLQVIGEPVIERGGQVVLFARRSPKGPYLRAVGMAQGVLHVMRQGENTVVVPGTSALSLMRRGADGALRPSSGALAGPTLLTDLDATVSALVESAAPAPTRPGVKP